MNDQTQEAPPPEGPGSGTHAPVRPLRARKVTVQKDRPHLRTQRPREGGRRFEMPRISNWGRARQARPQAAGRPAERQR